MKPYTAFVSYKREDRLWADRIRSSLEQRGLRIYQDTLLRSGEDWSPQLGAALADSQHLVVLWSTKAQTPGGWVDREMNVFDLTCCKDLVDGPRRLIIILLDVDDPPKAFGRLHTLNQLRRAGATSDDAASVPEGAWSQFIDILYEDLTQTSSTQRIASVVLASTKTFWTSMDFQAASALVEPLDRVLDQVGLRGPDADPYREFTERYGDRRDDWCPFGKGGPAVSALLRSVQGEVNEALQRGRHATIRLDPVDERFWTGNLTDLEAVIRELENSPSLVLIDPLSLHDPEVHRRLQWLRNCLNSERSAALLLGPFGWGTRSDAIRRHIQSLALDIYHHFFEPPVPLRGFYAPSAVHVGDRHEIKRLLLLALGRTSRNDSPPPTPFLSHSL